MPDLFSHPISKLADSTIKMQRLLSKTLYIIFTTTCFLALQACESVSNYETAYQYTWNSEIFEEIQPKRIIISHVNIGAPSRKYMHDHEAKIDGVVKARLIEGGFEVIDNQRFKSIWRGAVRKHGAPFDNETGHRKSDVLEGILYDVLNEIKKNDLADAILFTDLVERNVVFSGRGERKARWDGVSRTPRLSSTGTIPEGFDWAQSITSASLLTVLYSSDQRFIFKSVGGLDLTRDINPRSSEGRLVRKKNLFANSRHLKEGVALALHPLVPLKGYPEE